MRPPFDEFPVLVAEKIRLRPISESDFDDIAEISFYDGRAARDAGEARTMMSRINIDYQNGESVHWGIARNTDDRIVGTCGYYRGFANDTGELGFVMRPLYRGNGYMSAAVRVAAAFGLHKMGLHRVIAITSAQNEAAIRVLEHSQFIRTGNSENDLIEFELCSI